ncbi:RNA-binding protein [Streptomyces sp. NBRC 110611]|nr:RNA-binding protein [Streptomyces sp. NBRC 110611]
MEATEGEEEEGEEKGEVEEACMGVPPCSRRQDRRGRCQMAEVDDTSAYLAGPHGASAHGRATVAAELSSTRPRARSSQKQGTHAQHRTPRKPPWQDESSRLVRAARPMGTMAHRHMPNYPAFHEG